jgi:hypothetical protein
VLRIGITWVSSSVFQKYFWVGERALFMRGPIRLEALKTEMSRLFMFAPQTQGVHLLLKAKNQRAFATYFKNPPYTSFFFLQNQETHVQFQ